MKRHKNFNLLLMLVLLVAVGQMAQTIYIPAIADMAISLNVREGAVQSVMAAYLLTYGVSQLFYGPLSDRVGRRPGDTGGNVHFYAGDAGLPLPPIACRC
ncbi:multidrug resistance protein D [Klebsiella michiganensis]|uniref:Multidrug resistance protein D n=1 Tax=Klebsiella michiganensis TaxID=1134687 RepID=A0A7H4M3H0_9ENTR|nr:multidrug resistance protein D [Klebsiella michiganensis]